ncbi:hypothetical protein H6776_02195 [Candidatus Nomurabacteria bacterium]|nr:hypothetical protein [Candidatus Nomurabacteria bacterium]
MNTTLFSKAFFVGTMIFVLLFGMFTLAIPHASAMTYVTAGGALDPYPSLYTTGYQTLPYYNYAYYGEGMNTAFYQQMAQFLAYLNGGSYYATPSYTYTPGTSSSSRTSFDKPDVTTDDAEDIGNHEAELNGEIDMNDAEDGLVFFVYGESRNRVEDVEDEDEYRDINERGDSLQKVKIDSSFDGDDDFSEDIDGLQSNTRIYYRLCVEFEDENADKTLECGRVERFDTD